MTKDMNIWAIKLNNSIVELRATLGPAKIIRSSLKKVKAIKTVEWDYTQYPAKQVTKFSDITLKQTTMIGGRFVGKTTYYHASHNLGLSFGKDDVVKLSPFQKATLLTPKWRKLYLL